MKAVLMLALSFNLLFVCTGCTNANTQKATNDSIVASSTNTTSPIDGAWVLVWAKYNGQEQTYEKPAQFKMFSNGVFSVMGIDTSGKLSWGGYGKYELDGNTFKEAFIYNDNPDYVGGLNWQKYEMKGDTLYMKGFDKVIVKGVDSTANFPKIEEKRVRLK